VWTRLDRTPDSIRATPPLEAQPEVGASSSAGIAVVNGSRRPTCLLPRSLPSASPAGVARPGS
jgi:hypothetical protein